MLAETHSDEWYGSNAPGSGEVQPSIAGVPSSSEATRSPSGIKEKIRSLWLHAVRRWPMVYMMSSNAHLHMRSIN